jgi:hypothetical protein
MSFNIPSPSIGQVFQNHHPFYVPKYQRGYAWETEELMDFIKDIRALQTQMPGAEPHFMGGMVHVYMAAANAVSRRHEVVDGQQRMATFTLTMLAILNGLDTISNTSQDPAISAACRARSEEIREAFFTYKETQGGQRVEMPKLVLSRADETFFRTLIGGGTPAPIRESHQRIQAAYRTLLNELVTPIVENGLTEAQKLQALIDLYKTISERCIVIHIVSQSRQEAYRLFSVLNDRGRTLSDGDLLRARTLELLESSPSDQDLIEPLWDGLLDGTAEDIDKYLRAYFPSKVGRRAPSKDIFDTFQQEFLQNPTANSIKEFVFNLANDKPAFLAIRQGEWPFPGGAAAVATAWDRDRLHRLVNILRHEAAHPLLLSAVKLGEKKFIEIVRLIELFVFRYITIVGAHPGPLYAPYNEEAKEMRIRLNSYRTKSLRDKLAVLQATRAPDAVFQNNLLAKLEYSDNNARNREIRHFLSTLESYSRWFARGGRRRVQPEPDTMHVFDIASTTLEHIYPQNATALQQDAAFEPSKHRLANLTIMSTSDNSNIGNSDFATKKSEFAASSISLTRRLDQFPAWSLSEFQARESELTQMATAIFNVV